MARRAGDTVLEAFEINNIAEIVLEQGRFDEAERLLDQAARIWQAAGYRSGDAVAKCNLGRVASGRGDYERALELFAESLEGAVRIGSQGNALEVVARRAECLLVAGEIDAALAAVDDAFERCRLLGGVPAYLPLLQRVRGVALSRRGEAEEAADALRASVAAARERGALHELASTLRVMAILGLSDVEGDADALAAASTSILADLGIERLPEILPLSAAVSAAS